jgi:DNA-binding response OmpR family regulator
MRGEVGVALARQHRPHLVLLDLNLPDINGEEVLARLKADPATRELPVVVISADATPRQIERLHASGATDYLTKPLDIDHFLHIIDEHVGADIKSTKRKPGLPRAVRSTTEFDNHHPTNVDEPSEPPAARGGVRPQL